MAKRASRKTASRKASGRTRSARAAKVRKVTRKAAPAPRDATTPKAAPPPSQPIHRFSAASVPQPAGSKGINTIIYIHGITNKPTAAVLKCQWDKPCTAAPRRPKPMAYWVNRNIYPTPINGTCPSGTLDIDPRYDARRLTYGGAGRGGGHRRLVAENPSL